MAKPRSDSSLNPVTLRFRDARTESGYQAFGPSARIAPIRAVLVFIITVGLAEMIYRALVAESASTLHLVSILAVYGVMAGVVAWTFHPGFAHRADTIAMVVMPIIVAACITHIIQAPVDRQRAMVGIYYILLLANVMLPYTHLIKHLMGATIALATFVLPLALAAEDARTTRLLVGIAVGVASILGYVMEKLQRQQFALNRELDAERLRSDALLRNTLPAQVAERLKQLDDDTSVDFVEEFDEAAVLFIDVVGFTPMAASLPAAELVGLLNALFSRLDAVIAHHGLEKIKTIGDAYMAVAGVPTPRSDALTAAANAAFDVLSAVRQFALISERDLSVRIGLHVGPVVAGIIGRHKFQYDLWGNTVNVAARLEATSSSGRVHVLRSVAERLHGDFIDSPRGVVHLKGLGDLETSYLDPKPVVTSSAIPDKDSRLSTTLKTG